MNDRIPLESPESELLEFKSKEVLLEPEKVAREVVAMLNAPDSERGGAGEIWIGVRQSPIGVEVQAIEDPEGERRRLQDYLLDGIEPRPAGREVSVSTVAAATQGGPVLLVEVQPPDPSRRPFAQLRPHGGRYYLRRFGGRLIPMSREEIFGLARHTSGSRKESQAVRRLRDGLHHIVAQSAARLWLGIEPETPGEVAFDRVDEAGLLTDPTRSGTPRSAFNFTIAASYGGPRLHSEPGATPSLRLGNDSIALRLFKTGGLQFEAALENLSAGRVPFIDQTHLLSPEPILGYLVSTLRLTSALLNDRPLWRRPPGGPWWALLGITGLEGWSLLPGNLGNAVAWRHEIRRFQWHDFIPANPLAFPREEILQDPEGCAMRLVHLLYEAFGIYRARELPIIAAAGLLPEA